LADNFALVARLIVFFLAFEAGLTGVAGLARRRFAHRAFSAAAICFFAEALMLRLVFAALADLADIGTAVQFDAAADDAGNHHEACH